MNMLSFLSQCESYPRNFVVRFQPLGKPEGIPTYFKWKSDAAIYRDHLNEFYGEAAAWIEDYKEEN